MSDIYIYENSTNSIPVNSQIINRATTEAQASVISDIKLQKFFQSAKLAQENFSKVLDENGEPLEVAHSTDKEFTAFKNKQENDSGWLGAGYYFFGDRSLDGQSR